ncbi:MAG: RsbRD N-terminal domain-containing protein [Terriglobales bacterium]
MDAAETILELWIARTAESYPRHAVILLSKEQDPFRAPVAATLRQGLLRLLQELSGEMSATAIDDALDPIIRLHVVQGLASEDAVRFVSLLKPILRELAAERDSAVLNRNIDGGVIYEVEIDDARIGVARINDGKIDGLAAMAADKYAQCRQQLAQIRTNEIHRMNHVQQRMRARRPA